MVTKQAHKLCLDAGTGSTSLKYDLYECTASERKAALQRALFWLAERATTSSKKLAGKFLFITVYDQKCSLQTESSGLQY